MTVAARPALACAVAALWMGLAAGPARAAPDESDQLFYRRASVCAAVLKQDVLALRERHRAGEQAVRGDIQRLTEASFAFIGTAYKRGLRNPRADELLAEAEQRQRGQPPAALRSLSADCASEGGRILAASNVIERALVRNRAKARVEQLLSDR